MFYHIFWIGYSDDLLEDINQPLRVQDHDVVEGGLVFRKTSKVNDATEVMVEGQHCFKVFINLQRNRHVSDLFNITRIQNIIYLRIKLFNFAAVILIEYQEMFYNMTINFIK